jgi:hypothetical protein
MKGVNTGPNAGASEWNLIGNVVNNIGATIGQGISNAVGAVGSFFGSLFAPTPVKTVAPAPKATSKPVNLKLSTGGMVPSYFAVGGFAKGTDTIPAMLTPGEFVMKKYAVDNFGADKLKAINNGTYSGGSVYNYDVNINVRSEANVDDIARTVITEIKRIDSHRLRGNKF